ncbi:hypothetical protein [Pantoea ananatis]|uniref:hypothetical protein n=1 Tax=Pantoea ananas TaxID=553 RepID=UPI0023504A43|nr:hypothetical protein [Pantoea ananatis]
MMLKALVTGKLSLAKTFWGWGFGGNALIVAISEAGVHAGQYWMLSLTHALQALLTLAVLCGLASIVKVKHTMQGMMAGGMAFALLFGYFILSPVFAVRFSSVIFF